MKLIRTLVAAAVVVAATVAFPAEKIKVACIGDSITYGFKLKNRETDAYPAQLQTLLEARFPGKYEVRNFGNSGRGVYLDTMRGKERRGFRFMPEHQAALEWRPDIVICNLGINDMGGEYMKEHTGTRPRGQFVEEYTALLGDYVKKNPATRFFIWTKFAPLTEKHPSYRHPTSMLMQTDLNEVARRVHATGIDMLEPLREKMDETLAADGVHPDPEGSRTIAEATFKALMSEALPPVTLPADVSDGNREVWLFVGQANMQRGWGEFCATPTGKECVAREMARLEKVDIRFWDFNDDSWTKLSPTNAPDKCAFGISFATRRAEATGKTVVMLYVSAGGAPTESFLSEQTMCAVGKDGRPVYPRLAAIATNRHRLDKNADYPDAREYSCCHGNTSEVRWWTVSSLYDAAVARIRASGVKIDGVFWDQGESNASACVATNEPIDAAYQEEVLRAVVAELRGGVEIPFVMMGLPTLSRLGAAYGAAQKKVCEDTGAIYVDPFASGLGNENAYPWDKAAFAAAAFCAAAKEADVLWTRVIAQEPGRQCSWPSVAKAADGSIIAVFSGDREAHICPWGKVQMVKSKDGGETWSAPRTIGKTKLDDRDAGVVLLPDGRLFVTWFNSVAYRTYFDIDTTNYPPGTAKAKWQEFDRSMSDAEKRENCGFYGVWSSDNGETWTKPEKLSTLRSQTPHGPILLKDGSLLQFGRRFDDNLKQMFTPKYWEHTTITVEQSADGGHTWKTLCDGIPDSTGENDKRKYWFHEPHVAELPNGELYALIRADYAKDVLMRQTRSKDGGKTWEPITPTTLSGLPPHLLVLSDGRLLAVYGRRTKDRGGFGEYASISSDGGRTWDEELKLSGATNPDLGYPASIELSPGIVLTVYYQKPSTGGKPCIMATKWRVKK